MLKFCLIKYVQCDSENIEIKEVETELWIEDEIYCKDCGAQMTEDGSGGYLYYLGGCENWLVLFKETLTFPFDAEVYEWQEKGSSICEGDKVKVCDLVDEDDLYGVIATITKEGIHCVFPIVDLIPLNVDKKIKNLFDAYQYWFANGQW